MINILANTASTMNFHHDGVTPESYAQPPLSDFYTVVSTNVDRRGRAFVSTVEARDYPIYGVQWHPERPQFEFTPGDDIPHKPAAIRAMQSAANFFVDQARASKHRFANTTHLQKLLIENYCPVRAPCIVLIVLAMLVLIVLTKQENFGYGNQVYIF